MLSRTSRDSVCGGDPLWPAAWPAAICAMTRARCARDLRTQCAHDVVTRSSGATQREDGSDAPQAAARPGWWVAWVAPARGGRRV